LWSTLPYIRVQYIPIVSPKRRMPPMVAMVWRILVTVEGADVDVDVEGDEPSSVGGGR